MLPGMRVYHCPADGTRPEITALTWCCPVCRGPWDLDFTPARGVAPNALSLRVDSLWRHEEFLPRAARAAAVRAGGTRGTCSIRRPGGPPVRGPCVP
ncbi:hypothetical protein AMK20_14190 [Streptomyces sp. TSRI0261]|nr:hypothetical protein AMK20_14190 [Streptomyces sp. TSRI0261]